MGQPSQQKLEAPGPSLTILKEIEFLYFQTLCFFTKNPHSFFFFLVKYI